MQLRIENIGPIGSAHIDLMGLTVIGGLNDTGKSTIGKSLFAVVQAIRNRENEYAGSQRKKVNIVISELVSELRTIRGSHISPISFRKFTGGLLDINKFTGDDSKENLDNAINDARDRILSDMFYRIVRPAEPTIEFENNPRNISRQEAIVDASLDRIREILSSKVNPKEMYFASLNRMLDAVMTGEINNKRANEIGKIALWDNEREILSSTFRNNVLSQLDIEEDVVFSLFDEVTLIESPFALNYADGGTAGALNNTGRFIPNAPSSLTVSDLLDKLSFALNEAIPNNPLEQIIADTISKTIEGKIFYDSEEQGFFFSSNDEVKVSIANTASGVKTLGIIQMLASAGFLNDTNLLIIDEPEVHLHPAWQIVFAEIIAQLVSNNVYCLVSSHSPYFIQAIEAFSEIYKLKESTNFYISKKQRGSCYFEDITDNLEPLYKLLADPMKKIAYLRAKAQNG